MANRCEHCILCKYAREKPNTAISRMMHLHGKWCPFWKAHLKIYGEKTPKLEIRNKVVLSLDEKKAILTDMERENREYYVITYFLAKLGWRINETLSLKKNLIRWKDGNPASITLEKPFRKNRKEFTLTTIDKKLAAVIVSYLHWQTDKSEWFFPNSKGKMIKKETYRGYLHKVSTRVLKRNVNPHDFRHSLITHLKGVRVPNKDIMQITGHMDERVLNDHYSHSTETGRMEALV